MGATAKGLPFPDGTDFVIDGNDSIQALAEAVDVQLDDYKQAHYGGMTPVLERRPSDTGSVGTSEVAVISSAAFTLDSLTWIKMTAFWQSISSSVDLGIIVAVRINSLTGTVAGVHRDWVKGGVHDGGNTFTCMTELPAGEYTCHLTLRTSTGTAVMTGGVTYPRTLLIEPQQF